MGIKACEDLSFHAAFHPGTVTILAPGFCCSLNFGYLLYIGHVPLVKAVGESGGRGSSGWDKLVLNREGIEVCLLLLYRFGYIR